MADTRPDQTHGGLRDSWPPAPWRRRLAQMLVVLWAAQLALVAWHFAPEAQELAARLRPRPVGRAAPGDDPFHLWLVSLARLIPPQAAYLFLDTYEKGKETEARYHLFPRRHVLLPPDSPPTFLFHALRRERPDWVILRDGNQPPGPGLEAALAAGLVEAAPLAGPGRVFRVRSGGAQAAFYD